jgi:hypothetical protein
MWANRALHKCVALHSAEYSGETGVTLSRCMLVADQLRWHVAHRRWAWDQLHVSGDALDVQLRLTSYSPSYFGALYFPFRSRSMVPTML